MADIALTSKYNKDVGQWTSQTRRIMKNEVLRLVISKGPGYKNLQSSVQKYRGEASKLGFLFPYYMVFVHKGAGRGYGGNKTGFFSRKNGSKGETNKASMGKMGTGKRIAKPWFNPVIEKRFPELANLVADYKGNSVVLNIQRILID